MRCPARREEASHAPYRFLPSIIMENFGQIDENNPICQRHKRTSLSPGANVRTNYAPSRGSLLDTAGPENGHQYRPPARSTGEYPIQGDSAVGEAGGLGWQISNDSWPFPLTKMQ